MFTLDPNHIDVQKTGLLISLAFGIAAFIWSWINYAHSRARIIPRLLINVEDDGPRFKDYDVQISNAGNSPFTVLDAWYTSSGQKEEMNTNQFSLGPGEMTHFNLIKNDGYADMFFVKLHDGSVWKKKMPRAHRPTTKIRKAK